MLSFYVFLKAFFIHYIYYLGYTNGIIKKKYSRGYQDNDYVNLSKVRALVGYWFPRKHQHDCAYEKNPRMNMYIDNSIKKIYP